MIFFTTTTKRALTTSVVAAAVAIGSVVTTAVAQNRTTLNGAGATFPEPLYQKYAAEIRKSQPITINYQGIGSGGGIKQMIAGSVDFAGSDTAMTDAEASQVGSRGVLFVPTAGGAVAVIYNVRGVSNLKLSRSVLPAIFAGQITNWNDAKIKADNPGANLPNQPIKLAVRADSSGTSYIFTNHLSAINPYFRGRVGANKAPRWTAGALKAKGNPGVAAAVKQTAGSIGYVEANFARGIQTAQVQNKQGSYVAPTVEEAKRALGAVQFNSDNRVNFTKLGDPAQGYPITGLTWIMVYKQYPDAAKAAAIKKMVTWILKEGQAFNPPLGYTQIPEAKAQQVTQMVGTSVTSSR